MRRWLSRERSVALALVLPGLSSCGGGGGPQTPEPAPATAVLSAPALTAPPTVVAPVATPVAAPAPELPAQTVEPAPAAPPASPIELTEPDPPPPQPGPPVDPITESLGQWSAEAPWPLVALHAALLPDGRVMSYGTDRAGKQTGSFVYDVWDPTEGTIAGGHLTLPNRTGTDLFCSAQMMLSTGSLLLAGGDVLSGGDTTNTGNPDTNLFDPQTQTLTRSQGMFRPRWYATLTKTHDDRVFVQGGFGGEDRPELREPSGAHRLLSAIDTTQYYWWYPRNFSAPDGRVFGFATDGGAYTATYGGTGGIVRHGTLLMAQPGVASGAALFAPARVLVCGGGDACSVVDYNGPRPSVESAGRIAATRNWHTSTLLPDGRVLLTGGARQYSDTAFSGATNQVELWDPRTGTWTTGAAGVQPRLYHSTALLLPDATVLVAGGGAPGPLTQLNAEIYRPPYLFRNGAVAARPLVVSAPASLTPGEALRLQVGDGSRIARLVLIKTGSVTHGFNHDQAFVELPFSRTGNTITATVPDSGGDLTPGFYMIFVLDTAGVPSVAKIARMNIATTSPPIAPWTPEAGSASGSPFRLECEAGQVMVGAHGLAGPSVSRLGPICAWVGTDGRWIGEPWKNPVAGTSVTGGAFEATCAQDHAVSGVQMRTAAPGVAQLQLQCRALAAGGLRVQAGTGARTTPVGSSTGGTASALLECGGGFAGHGLYGWAGPGANTVGVLCRRPVDAIRVKPAGSAAQRYAWRLLGDENVTYSVAPCSFVRLGVSESGPFTEQVASGLFPATVAFFGIDPAPGQRKKVWLRVPAP